MTLLGLLTANETSRYEGGIALSGYLPLLESLNDVSFRTSYPATAAPTLRVRNV